MKTYDKILKQAQSITRHEKLLTVEKIKRRRADTRRKIELGGLVIKAGLGDYNKSLLLGAFDYIYRLMISDAELKNHLQENGNSIFEVNKT